MVHIKMHDRKHITDITYDEKNFVTQVFSFLNVLDTFPWPLDTDIAKINYINYIKEVRAIY